MRHRNAVLPAKVDVQSHPNPVADMCSLFHCILYATIPYSTFQQDLPAALQIRKYYIKCKTLFLTLPPTAPSIFLMQFYTILQHKIFSYHKRYVFLIQESAEIKKESRQRPIGGGAGEERGKMRNIYIWQKVGLLHAKHSLPPKCYP